MIKINLCPIDELESQYWYVPDLVTTVVIMAAAFFGVQYYLGQIQDQIDAANGRATSLQESTQRLAPDLERFKTLDADIKALNEKLSALKLITVSKIAKYRPVIVLEHLQNLKPEGVWYSHLKIGFGEKNTGAPADPAEADHEAAGDNFEVTGQAFDNILTAELMTSVRSTESQELDEADLRTQVFFSALALEDAKIPKGTQEAFPEMSRFPEFTIKGLIKERTTAAKPEDGGGKDEKGKKPAAPGVASGDKAPGDDAATF